MFPDRPSGPVTTNPAATAPAQMLRTAVSLHRQGHRTEAEALYRQVLQHQPNQPDALHLLGQLEHGRGHLNEALELYSRAATARPTAAFHISRGAVLLDSCNAGTRRQEPCAVRSLSIPRAPTLTTPWDVLLTTGARAKPRSGSSSARWPGGRSIRRH